VLLHRHLRAYAYADLDPETGEVRAWPLVKGWWRRRQGRPTVHGLYTTDGPIFVALYAAGGSLHLKFDQVALPVTPELTARVRRDDGRQRFEVLHEGETMLEHVYAPPKEESVLDGVDFTPHRELVEKDFFRFVAGVLEGDEEQRAELAGLWSRGFAT